MRDRDAALALARAMVDIGTVAGRRMAAIVSDMSQPLGRAIGHALEVAEALDTLENHGPPEFAEFAIELASLIVDLASAGQAGRADVEEELRSGAATAALRRMVEAQGGETGSFDKRARLPTARLQQPVLAEADGYLRGLDALTVARAGIELGAARERKGDPIDLAVGVYLEAKVGDRIGRGEPLAVLHANDPARLAAAERILRGGVSISATPVAQPTLILERLGTSAGSRA
jgi:pyrimidine-nucleoside phosphorylase